MRMNSKFCFGFRVDAAAFVAFLKNRPKFDLFLILGYLQQFPYSPARPVATNIVQSISARRKAPAFELGWTKVQLLPLSILDCKFKKEKQHCCCFCGGGEKPFSLANFSLAKCLVLLMPFR